MSITQCVLALAALYVGLAQSWDFVVSAGTQLIFFTQNGTELNTVDLIIHNPTALAYDEVHDTILYVDKQSYSETICSYNLVFMENKCLNERYGSNIHSIAFDPATDTLFFTDTNERSIYSISKPVYNNYVDEKRLIEMDNRTPSDIAVDSCRGYIYWTNTNIKEGEEYIERALFNGSKRENVKSGALHTVHSMALDLQTRLIYYFDTSSGWCFNKNVMDRDIKEHYFFTSDYVEPKELTVSNYYLYWMNINENYRTVWRLPTNPRIGEKPTQIHKFHNKRPLGIAANYKIIDQISGDQQCEALSRSTTTVTDNSLNVQQTTEQELRTVTEKFCVHGIKVSETSVCKCTPGYIGERCDVSVCEDYCLQGNCSFNDEGLPKCRCNAGYSGKRCEASVCYRYCLNNGTCSMNETSEPVCQCKGDYVGDRCEVSDCLNYCIQGECSLNEEGHPKCRCNAGYSGESCETSVCYRYCLNNGTCSLNEKSEPVCECIEDYVGDRCEVSDCLNYCNHGECSLNEEGHPKCRCNAGYSGARCEVYACHGYCLNNGVCSLNEEDEPVCQCVGNHGGTRCEAVEDDTFSSMSIPTFSAGRKYTLADLLLQCFNYCLQGICSFTDDGPLCRCNAGYSGARCEVFACHGYCLNNGVCSLSEEDEPVCQCIGNHGGTRCEADVMLVIPGKM